MKSTKQRRPKSILAKMYPEYYGHPYYKGSYAACVVSRKRKDATRSGKRSWELSDIEAFNLILAPCVYCGQQYNWPNTFGTIDRIDNNKNYTTDNCAPACLTHNLMKRSLSLDEFKCWIGAIKNKHAQMFETVK